MPIRDVVIVERNFGRVQAHRPISREHKQSSSNRQFKIAAFTTFVSERVFVFVEYIRLAKYVKARARKRLF